MDLIDRIYECAFLPELWPNVLDELAGSVQGRGCVLITGSVSKGISRWTASEPIRDDVGEYFSSGWLQKSARIEFLGGSQHAGFFSQAATTTEELALDPGNKHFLMPRGFGWAAASTFSIPTGDTMIISVERDIFRGLVEPETLLKLDGLRPHLARSGLLSMRFQMERARALSEALGTIGLPAVVMDAQGSALALNGLAEQLKEHIRWRPKDRVSLKDPDAEKLFKRAIVTLGTSAGAVVRSFPVRGSDGTSLLVAHVIPIEGSARDLILRCAAILVLTPVTLPDAPPVELIRSLFDLTAAEARVARSLAVGVSIGEIASGNSVSVNTIRTHVRGVLEKTGCRRQAEVVALLSAINVGPPASGTSLA